MDKLVGTLLGKGPRPGIAGLLDDDEEEDEEDRGPSAGLILTM